MPLRANKGRPIAVKPSLISELLGHTLDGLEALPGEGEAGLLGPPPRPPLDVRPVRQLMDKWCWAACARMVLRFFGGTLEQCGIVGRFLGGNCCPSASAPGCNVDCSVEQVDQAFGIAGLTVRRIPASVTFEVVQAQINGGRPLVAAVKWAGGGGHVVVIHGCRTVGGDRYLSVNDPFYGFGDIRYGDMTQHYGKNNTGLWVHTWLDFSL